MTEVPGHALPECQRESFSPAVGLPILPFKSGGKVSIQLQAFPVRCLWSISLRAFNACS